MISYRVIRRRRARLSLRVDSRGDVVVSAPVSCPDRVISEFVVEHTEWIHRALKTVQKKKEVPIPHTQHSFHAHNARAKKILTERVRFFASQMGVTVSRVSIKRTRSQWGSCSTSGALSLHYKLIFLPREVMDYVVVHEVCHRIHHNHSSAFWRAVELVLPDYRQAQNMLREYTP